MAEIVEGYASKESPLFKDMLASDAGPLSLAIQARGNYRATIHEIPFSAYTDQAYADQELEYVWRKSWQYACREEDIPAVGDRFPYDVGPLSFMVVRTGPESFKAFYNACLHRGTRLCNESEGGDEIKCPFHGWRWHIDGALKRVPSKWDFPDVDASFALPEIKIARWGGCLFVNPDPNAGPLDASLGALVDHFAHFDLADRFTLVRTAKKIRANWKTVWAAFLEAYHVEETHFDAMEFTGDVNTQYDAFQSEGAVISRLITPAAVPSPLLQDKVTAREAAILAVQSFAAAFGPDAPVAPPDYENASEFGRREVAAWRRQSMSAMMGADFSHLCDAEMIDSIQYAMFPNFGPWLGEGLPLMYQFLPLGNNPDESLFTVRLMAPIPDGAPRPPCPPLTTLDFDEFFESLPEWGRIAHVFDQDMANLPNIQRGMHSAAASRSQLTLGRYQEQRIALMHEFVEARHQRAEIEMTEALSLYDVGSTLGNIDANVPYLLFFGALALICNFTYFGSGIYWGFKHKVVSMPIAATLIFIPHDLVYLLMYDKWFNVYDHWFNQLYWVGLVITNIEECFFLYLTLKYGRKEYMPSVTQRTWVVLVLLGLAGAFAAFVALKQVLADELWLFTFGLTLWFCVPLVIPMMLRRNSTAGQSRLMWMAFIGMAVSYWCAMYPLDPFFRSLPWLALGAVSVAWAAAILWFMRFIENKKARDSLALA